MTKPKEGQELSRFKAVENTNYAVELASANGMRMVGIQGADIVDGTRTLVLGLVWQLMRLNIDKTLASLSRNGKGVTDTEIVRWANDTVAKSGKKSSMRSLRDSALANGHFFLDLVDSLRPGIVDQSLVEPGNTEDECILNGGCSLSLPSLVLFPTWLTFRSSSPSRDLRSPQARRSRLRRRRGPRRGEAQAPAHLCRRNTQPRQRQISRACEASLSVSLLSSYLCSSYTARHLLPLCSDII